jgi:parallel beta-helix repeat protein
MSMKGWPFLRIALLAALLLFSGIAIPVAATDLTYAGQTITISSSGSYVLTNDVTDSRLATCIEIRAPDVTFDGGGHRIDGTGAGGSTGIYVRPTAGRNVTIRNVRVRDWDYGVYLHGATDSRIESSVLEENLFCGAVFYLNATGNTVAGCNLTGNDYGLVLSSGADRCAVVNSRITGNGCGIYLYDSDGVTVTRNIIEANTETGVRYSLSGSSTVYDNRFDNALNVALTGEPPAANTWSVEPRGGPNIAGGPSIGGNFWAKPDGTGFS